MVQYLIVNVTITFAQMMVCRNRLRLPLSRFGEPRFGREIRRRRRTRSNNKDLDDDQISLHCHSLFLLFHSFSHSPLLKLVVLRRCLDLSLSIYFPLFLFPKTTHIIQFINLRLTLISLQDLDTKLLHIIKQ